MRLALVILLLTSKSASNVLEFQRYQRSLSVGQMRRKARSKVCMYRHDKLPCALFL